MTTDQHKLYADACFIRAFEHAIARCSDAGEVPGLVHLCTGAEVAEVALAAALDNRRDQMTGSHRSHGLALALGADPLKVAKEILGRTGGLSNGLAGTQHLMAPEAGFLTSNGIVGAQVPLAAGAALSAKLRNDGGLGIAVFGDGAANQGAVLETLNLAVVLRLPMLFVLENNGFGQSTASEYASGGGFCARAAAFGLKTINVDSLNQEACQQAFVEAVSAARKHEPVFVEVAVTRLDGHYYGEKGDYRNSQNDRDPLQQMHATLVALGVLSSALDSITAVQKKRADDIVAAALAAPKAGAAEVEAWHSKLEVMTSA